MNRPPVLVLLSGGLDSLGCVQYYTERGRSVSALFVNYDQPAVSREQAAATAIATYYRVPLATVTVTGLACAAGSIPGRNMMLLCFALNHIGSKAALISLGVHSGTSYSDCSPELERVGEEVVALYTSVVKIDLPFLTWSKGDIWNYLRSAGAPTHLSYSCEEAGLDPCGHCSSCRDRGVLHVS